MATTDLFDPWGSMKSRNGMPCDELIAGVQKAIRHADLEIAIDMAYELYTTSEELENKLWRRLHAIAVEDIGFGDPMAAVLVNNCNQMRKEFLYNDGDRAMFFFHVIRYLCRSFSCFSDLLSIACWSIVIGQKHHRT